MMSIVIVDSVIDSYCVLQKVVADNSGVESRYFAECYQNGREQGFLIFGFKNSKAIYWSHHRNTDGIVVYVGDYSMQGISESAYRNSYFAEDLDDAARYISEQVKFLENN